MYGLDWAGSGSARGVMRWAPARCAQLAAATETLRVSINVVFEVGERKLFERTVATAKESLGEAGFQSAWEAGQKL